MLWHKCRCGALIPQGIQRCPDCEAGSSRQMSRHMEYNLYRRNKKTAQFYISKEWRGLRAFVISKYDGLDLYAFYVQKKIATADMVTQAQLRDILRTYWEGHGGIEKVFSNPY